MAAVSKPGQHLMRCPSKSIIWIITALLIGQAILGCVSFHIDKINDGADIPPLPEEFKAGKTSLQEVLNGYGAPAEIVDMKGHFALHYQRTMDRAGHISIGIPVIEVFKAGPKLNARGNLLRHDAVVFVFTPEGLLEDMIYEKGTSRPLWDTFWK
jgi:hypothetical protein